MLGRLAMSSHLSPPLLLVPPGCPLCLQPYALAAPSSTCAGHMLQAQVGNTVRDDGYVPAICAFARPLESDLQKAWDAVSGWLVTAC